MKDSTRVTRELDLDGADLRLMLRDGLGVECPGGDEVQVELVTGAGEVLIAKLPLMRLRVTWDEAWDESPPDGP